ncbi:ABC transporter substrate binding protein, partial [Brachyspira hyodysenteriae]|uniref:ABC transporter substrate binding protein n=1 Tax=Brachyspira hyodysenteriae TaxID=159 RepID=UPI0023B984BC
YIVFSPFSRWDTKDLSVNKSREIIKEIQKLKDIQIIVSGIGDPIGARLVTNLNKPNVNVTGIINLPPISKQI